MSAAAAAAALLRAAAAAGVSLRLAADGAVRAQGRPSPELLAELRRHKAAIATILAAPSWADLAHWRRRLVSAGLLLERIQVLCDWSAAAGGTTQSDALTIHLPADLPRNLALAELKALARMLGFQVRAAPTAQSTAA